MRIVTRRATVVDADQLAHHVTTGFASHRAFAPPGWEPPPAAAERAHTRELLADPDTWALLACVDGKPAGHVLFTPARRRATDGSPANWRAQPVIPRLAHLSHLFVLPPWWGAGVAPRLHDAAVDAMRGRGFVAVRLYTPSAHARARRFYERRGWELAGEAMNVGLRLALAEYRLALVEPPAARPTAGAPGG